MSNLTPRQRDILALMTEGCTIPQIADRLFVSSSTIKAHIDRIYRALGVAGLGNPGWRAVALFVQSGTAMNDQRSHGRL